jgi:hypothetical protein
MQVYLCQSPVLPLHQGTQGTQIEYAMPHREKHDFRFTPNKENPRKGGAGARIIFVLALLESRMCDCTSVGEVTGSQRLQRDGEWKQSPRRLCGEADWIQGFTRRSNQTSRLQ